MANSPTRSLFSSVWVYFQKSFSSSRFSECASVRRLPFMRMVSGVSFRAAELRAEIIPDHAVDHKGPVDLARSREDFSAREGFPIFQAR